MGSCQNFGVLDPGSDMHSDPSLGVTDQAHLEIMLFMHGIATPSAMPMSTRTASNMGSD